MPYWRSIKFWLLLVVGWLIGATCFSVLARLFASFDDITRAEVWITGITIHVLAALAGFSFARSRTRHSNPPGFPVIAKSDGGPDADNQTLHWTGATTVLVIRTLVVGPGQ